MIYNNHKISNKMTKTLKTIIASISLLLITSLVSVKEVKASNPNPFKEYYLLQKYSKYVKKDKDGYKIYPDNGKVIEFKSRKSSDRYNDWTDDHYTFENYLKDIGYFIFSVGFVEDYAYLLINKNNGQQYWMPQYPTFLPDKKIIFSPGLSDTDVEERLATAYKVLPDKLEKIEFPNFLSAEKHLNYDQMNEYEAATVKKFETKEEIEAIKKLMAVTDRKVVIEIVQNYPSVIRDVNSNYRDDEEIMAMVISQDPPLIGSASDRLKNDKKFILNNAKPLYLVMEGVSDQLKDDEEFVITVLKDSGVVLKYVSNRLKDDEEVVLIATTKDPSSISYASERLRSDKKFIENLIIKNNDYSLFQYASKNLKDDKEFVIYMMKKHNNSRYQMDEKGSIFPFILDRLKNDPEVLKEKDKRNH